MPVLTVPLEDRKSRPLRKFFSKTPPPEIVDAISPSFRVDCRSSSTPRVILPQTRGQKRIYAFSSRSLICFLRLLIFLPYCQCIHGSGDIYVKEVPGSMDPHLRMALLSSFSGSPNVSRTEMSVHFKPCFCISPIIYFSTSFISRQDRYPDHRTDQGS